MSNIYHVACFCKNSCPPSGCITYYYNFWMHVRLGRQMAKEGSGNDFHTAPNLVQYNLTNERLKFKRTCTVSHSVTHITCTVSHTVTHRTCTVSHTLTHRTCTVSHTLTHRTCTMSHTVTHRTCTVSHTLTHRAATLIVEPFLPHAVKAVGAASHFRAPLALEADLGLEALLTRLHGDAACTRQGTRWGRGRGRGTQRP